MLPDDSHWMTLAIDQARRGIADGQSPFGAVIVRGGSLVAAGHNEVWRRTDPTAHAEVVCIQRACEALRTIDLSGSEMYTTTEPCPMCAAAIHWSKLASVHFGTTIADALHAGFSELTVPIDRLYRDGNSPVRLAQAPRSVRARCAGLFDEWKAAGGKSY
ncbi:MAG: nucleoside deaminase [Phycisphaerales bacterium]